MCLAIPGKISQIEGHKAIVQYEYQTSDGKTVQEAHQALIGEKNLQVGDYVLVQMGIATRKMSQSDAETALHTWSHSQK